MTEEQIQNAAKNLDKGIDDHSAAGTFLRKSEASCQSVAYTAAAAKAARRKMYALCDYFGIPSIFFTITPCDECTFRVRLWANAGKRLEMPSVDSPDSVCVADFSLRKETRLMYPGACALEYESMVQIVIKCLFRWDSGTQTGEPGVFGTLEAHCVAHEEQGTGNQPFDFVTVVSCLNVLH